MSKLKNQYMGMLVTLPKRGGRVNILADMSLAEQVPSNTVFGEQWKGHWLSEEAVDLRKFGNS